MSLLARRHSCHRLAREVEADLDASMHLGGPDARDDKMDNLQRRVRDRYSECIADETVGQALAGNLFRQASLPLFKAVGRRKPVKTAPKNRMARKTLRCKAIASEPEHDINVTIVT